MKKKIDFENLVKNHGYVNARQLLKRSMAEQHQYETEKKEIELDQSYEALRQSEAIQLSKTSGGVGNKSLIDKIVSANVSILELERALENHSLKNLIKKNEEKRSKDSFIRDEKVEYAFKNQNLELLIPNQDLEEFPLDLGDTLYLQLSYFTSLKCVRNKFRTLISPKLPQLSLHHFRYLQSIDLSLNKLVRLPDLVGSLKQLTTLNLSNNYISRLPSSFRELNRLHTLDLSSNSFSFLPEEFGFIDSLTNLNLSENLFTMFPYAVVRLRNIKKLSFNRNSVSSLAILPPLLQEKDMWMATIDRRTGKSIWMNILTREKIDHIEQYSGEGIKHKKDLHVFQSQNDVRKYRQRKMYLSVCQVHEWEPDTDVHTGRTYYRNNVSGETSWDLPSILNTIGNMYSIEELYLKNNAIKVLPESFVQLTKLVKLCLNRNRISDLPENFGNLIALQVLELSNNELKLLPVSLCDCKELIELLLDDNHLLRLPENLGFLPKLRKLDISHNRLKTVPFSIGYCTTLQFLFANENPLEDPPMSEFEKSTLNTEHILWYLRNRYLIEKRGKPPLISFHNISVNNEIIILEQELNETIQTRINSSVREGFLNLQLLGLREIPPLLLKAAHIKKLKLDFNPELQLPLNGFPREIRKLVSLSIRGCKLTFLPENIYIFEKLTMLNLEENLLEYIPDSICELLSLTNLNLSKNRLYQIPAKLDNLQSLQILNLEGNFLETLPSEIGSVTELKVLIVSKNRLVDIPEAICSLKSLRVLNVEKNQLINLPKSISYTNLIELRIGHNYIEVLSNDLFSFSLGKSIKLFSCVENNLLEIPESVVEIDSLCMVEFDYNPYVSPPSYLLSEGLVTIQNYFKIRKYRKRILYQLMLDEDFELSMESFTPQAHEVLEDGTGFLTPEDLASFDQAVDEYINGEFFKCPATGEEIVASVTKLREDRETELYLTIIRTFLSVVSSLVKSRDPRFPESSVYSAQRPWGKDGELCNVWVISLQALLRETSPNLYYPDGKPSIFQLIGDALPPISFPFTVDLLKDSIRLYISPYGSIADTETVNFPSCDCMDEFRNKPKRHNPCNKPAVVICKSCYVEEEAYRRSEEEDELLQKFEEIEEEIRIWILTEEGKTLLEKEVKRRKATLREEVQLREEMVLGQQLKLKKAMDQAKMVNSRKLLFEQGSAYETHGFHSLEEAIQAVNKADSEIQVFTDRIDLLKEKITELKAQLELDWKTSCRQAIADLLEKYCFISYEEGVKVFRQKALDNNLNRHWDGDEGELFERWKRIHIQTREDAMEESVDDDSEQKQEDDADLEPEFEWHSADKPEKFKNYLYQTYRRKNPFDVEF